MPPSKNKPLSISRLGLGSVQFGVDYGISNIRGKVCKADVQSILLTASNAGITVLDTASAYGHSEEILGQTLAQSAPFRIITKTPAFPGIEINKYDAKKIIANLEASLIHLKKKTVSGLLIHHGKNILLPGGKALIEALEQLKRSGLVEKIGVSVYSMDEIDQLLAVFTPDIVQLPYNLVDRRLCQSGHLEKLKNLGVEIHARSIFLQGLLLMPVNKLPDYFQPIRRELTLFRDSVHKADMSVLEACLYTGFAQPELDVLLIGVTTVSELEEIITSCARIDLYPKPPDLYQPIIKDPRYLDPSQWQS